LQTFQGWRLKNGFKREKHGKQASSKTEAEIYVMFLLNTFLPSTLSHASVGEYLSPKFKPQDYTILPLEYTLFQIPKYKNKEAPGNPESSGGANGTGRGSR